MKTEAKFRTTQIGSLPHPWVDAAMDYSFKESIPFLPQLISRSTQEFLIPQALQGLPGLKVHAGGYCEVDLNAWNQGAFKFNNLLDEAIKTKATTHFELTMDSASTWNPFLFELEEKNSRSAKIQICGPFTALWALKGLEKVAKDEKTALSSQILKLLMVRAHAMVSAVMERGVSDVLLFIDEPGLFSIQTIEQTLGFKDIGFFIQSLRQDFSKLKVGMHCCNHTIWSEALKLPLDYVSLDAGLSLEELVKNHSSALQPFLARGSRLSLGVVAAREETIVDFEIEKLIELLPKHLEGSLLTPSCGLGMLSVSIATEVQARLSAYSQKLEKKLS